ncbi:MAG TPA: hemolysin family protein [Candidatus Paenibacillus intestinavium]|nr:hemolysin family protein [Candidatus Paenibacillus intestinavium]
MDIGLKLFMIALLIFLTAFFVAAEFAIVRLRSSRIDQLVLEGKKGIASVQKISSNLDAYLSACQLGITCTALGLGFLGEPTVAAILLPLFHDLGISESVSHPVSIAIAFIVITFFHVVVGELAPKTWAIQKAEQISLLTAKPLIIFYKVLYPFIWALNGSANALTRLFGLHSANEHEDAHSEEEIQIILNESYQSGKINNTEYGYVSRIFAFDELLAKEIMVPRTDMVCLYTNNSLEKNFEVIEREQYTRFPVAMESKDNIVGMINTKQLFLEHQKTNQFDLKSLIHPVLSVSEVTPIKILLKRMQLERVHIAILVDEYGGTSGLITIEDIIEEIVGEIRDEFDADERKEIEQLDENCYLLDGKVLLDEILELTGVSFEDEEVETIGGWVYSKMQDPKLGKSLEFENLKFIVRETSKNRIRKIEMQIAVPEEQSEEHTA